MGNTMMKTAEESDRNTTVSPETMIDLLRAQVSLYAKLESLSSRQRSLVAAEDVGPLLALLADRRRVSEQLTTMAARLAPVRENWSVHRGHLSHDQRTEADRLLSESRIRLKSVMDNDEVDARVLSGRKQAVAGVLRKTHSMGEAISAYRPSVGGMDRTRRMDQGA